MTGMIEEKEQLVSEPAPYIREQSFLRLQEEPEAAPGSEVRRSRRAERRSSRDADEETALIHRARLGDLTARNRIMESNMGLVAALARRYTLPGLETADLIQEGSLGLVQAIERFDPSRGFRFSTYATWWVRRAVSRAVISQSRLIRIPCYVADDIYRIVRTANILRQQLEREPNADDVAAALGMTSEKVNQLQWLSCEPLSLETPTYNDDSCLGDYIPASGSQIRMIGLQTTDDPLARLVQREETERILSLLSDRVRQVLRMRYGLDGGEPQTREEVGQHFQISSEKVRQIEARACHRLKIVLSTGKTPRRKTRKAV
jgi:RNA polymerase primary sigma factor